MFVVLHVTLYIQQQQQYVNFAESFVQFTAYNSFSSRYHRLHINNATILYLKQRIFAWRWVWKKNKWCSKILNERNFRERTMWISFIYSINMSLFLSPIRLFWKSFKSTSIWTAMSKKFMNPAFLLSGVKYKPERKNYEQPFTHRESIKSRPD